MGKNTLKRPKSSTKINKTSTRQPDPIPGRSPYQFKADELIFILFDDADMPEFVKDCVSSFISNLEGHADVLNYRSVLQVALPLMLKEVCPDPSDLDSLFDSDSPVALDAYFDSADTNDREGRLCFTVNGMAKRGEESEDEKLKSELESVADALARILHSPHVPNEIKNRLGSALCDLFNTANVTIETPELLKAGFPLVIKNFMEGGASREES